MRRDDLLARAVFYKVGHHGSHNATLLQAFEKMNHPDLTALIPVDKKDRISPRRMVEDARPQLVQTAYRENVEPGAPNGRCESSELRSAEKSSVRGVEASGDQAEGDESVHGIRVLRRITVRDWAYAPFAPI